MKRTVALLTCLALLIPGASIALASGSGSTGCSYTHNCSLKKVDHASASRTPSTGSTSPSAGSTSPGVVNSADATGTTSAGSLPFTGLDVGALGAGAVVLLGAGMALRRVSSVRR